MRHGKYRFVASFLAIPLLLYVVYVISPYAQAFNIALTNWNGFSPPEYTGFSNFSRMFHDRLFIKAVEHNLFLLLALPLITVTIALFLSFMLNVGGRSRSGVRTGVWGSKFYRLVFFFPQVLAVAIIKFRRKDDSHVPEPLHGHTGLEIGWTIAPAVILIFIAVPTISTIFKIGTAKIGRAHV